jgi:hypothetical protein
MCRVEGGHPVGPLITRWAGPRRIYFRGDVGPLITYEARRSSLDVLFRDGDSEVAGQHLLGGLKAFTPYPQPPKKLVRLSKGGILSCAPTQNNFCARIYLG